MNAAQGTETPVPLVVRRAPIYWLAVGAFAVGTEGFMLGGILPRIAVDLGTTAAITGQLVTLFAFTYAISSPILTALSGHFNRRSLLIGAMVVFAIANLGAAVAPGYGSLLAARAILAMAAGLYVPGANALAGAIVPPAQRGKAIAIVNGGLTIAIAIGVPLGVVLASALSWRMMFVFVAVLGALATLGLFIGLDRATGAHLPVASLRERFAVMRRPDLLAVLATTTLWATGAYTVYTYLAVYLEAFAGLHGQAVGWMLFLWGISAGAGVMLGGNASDRVGPYRVIVPALATGALAFAVLSAVAHGLRPEMALGPIAVAVVIWGVAHWAFYPAQQVRLMHLAGLKAAPVALSLNASFMYLGFSLGALVGSVTLLRLGAANLGYVGAGFVLLALMATSALIRRENRAGA
jgi:predicted MFS family arabinose efflux permease